MVEGEHLKATGSREVISAWHPMILRHKLEVMGVLTGQTRPSRSLANDNAIMAADYEELTACIIELCQIAGYADEAQERMLASRRNLYPFQYATECAYFQAQVIRAKATAYWEVAIRAGS